MVHNGLMAGVNVDWKDIDFCISGEESKADLTPFSPLCDLGKVYRNRLGHTDVKFFQYFLSVFFHDRIYTGLNRCCFTHWIPLLQAIIVLSLSLQLYYMNIDVNDKGIY